MYTNSTVIRAKRQDYKDTDRGWVTLLWNSKQPCRFVLLQEESVIEIAAKYNVSVWLHSGPTTILLYS